MGFGLRPKLGSVAKTSVALEKFAASWPRLTSRVVHDLSERSTVTRIGGIVEIALSLYGLLILGRIVLSWLPLRSGTFAYRLYSFLHDATEPYLAIFRSFLPHLRLGNAALDLSPVVGLAVLLILETLVASL
jgi:uncharacterized protein YggT (Ycf19 family)